MKCLHKSCPARRALSNSISFVGYLLIFEKSNFDFQTFTHMNSLRMHFVERWHSVLETRHTGLLSDTNNPRALGDFTKL